MIMGTVWPLQRWFGISSTNYGRLITGILGGTGVGSVLWNMILNLWSITNFFA